MATALKVFYRNTAPTTSTTLYTSGTTETSTVTQIVIANESGAAATAKIVLDGATIVPTSTVANGGVLVLDMKQPIIATGTAKTITGLASASNVSFHISGVIY